MCAPARRITVATTASRASSRRVRSVVVVEDLISTAGSALDVVEALREAGAEVLGIASLFTYGMKKGLDRMAAAHVRNVSPDRFRHRCGRGRAETA